MLPTLRKMLGGGQRFRGELNSAREVYEDQLKKIRKLKTMDSGYGDYLSAVLVELRESEATVVKIIDRYGRDAVATGVFKAAKCEKRIQKVVSDEFARRSQVIRIQGPNVETETKVVVGCGGNRVNDARLYLLKQLANATESRTKYLGKLWQFMTSDNSIWLYSHEDLKKYRCIFYRLHVDQLNSSDLQFGLSIFVPMGVCGDDPAHYSMAESQAFTRAGWASTTVSSKTISETDTWNVNQTKSRNYGHTLGKTLNQSYSQSRGEQKSSSHTSGEGESSTLGETTSWSESHSYTRGSEQSSSTASYGTSGGKTISDTVSRNNSQTELVGIQTGETITEGEGSSESESFGKSLAISEGVSEARGQSMQFQTFHYGVDFSVGNDVLFRQWLDANGDKKDEVSLLKDWFQSFVAKAEKHLDSKQRFQDAPLGAEKSLLEFSEFILRDPVLLDVKRRSD